MSPRSDPLPTRIGVGPFCGLPMSQTQLSLNTPGNTICSKVDSRNITLLTGPTRLPQSTIGCLPQTKAEGRKDPMHHWGHVMMVAGGNLWQSIVGRVGRSK